MSKFAAMSSLIIISLIIGYIAGLQTEVYFSDIKSISKEFNPRLEKYASETEQQLKKKEGVISKVANLLNYFEGEENTVIYDKYGRYCEYSCYVIIDGNRSQLSGQATSEGAGS